MSSTGRHFRFNAMEVYVMGLYPYHKRALHRMMTSSNGNISALLAICAGNSPVTGEFPAQRPVTRSFDVFFLCAPE